MDKFITVKFFRFCVAYEVKASLADVENLWYAQDCGELIIDTLTVGDKTYGLKEFAELFGL